MKLLLMNYLMSKWSSKLTSDINILKIELEKEKSCKAQLSTELTRCTKDFSDEETGQGIRIEVSRQKCNN